MFAGTLTRNVETAAAQYTGMIHSTRFDFSAKFILPECTQGAFNQGSLGSRLGQ